jgi:hypothetical protein
MFKRPSFYIVLAALFLASAYWTANQHADATRSFITAGP